MTTPLSNTNYAQIVSEAQNKIKELLLTTSLSNREIAEMVKASEETVRRIKVGECFYDKKLNYPLKTCNDYSE